MQVDYDNNNVLTVLTTHDHRQFLPLYETKTTETNTSAHLQSFSLSYYM